MCVAINRIAVIVFFGIGLMIFLIITVLKHIANQYPDYVISECNPCESPEEAKRRSLLITQLRANSLASSKVDVDFDIRDIWIEKAAHKDYRYVWFSNYRPAGYYHICISLAHTPKMFLDHRVSLTFDDHTVVRDSPFFHERWSNRKLILLWADVIDPNVEFKSISVRENKETFKETLSCSPVASYIIELNYGSMIRKP
jgi:hypothetical protein